MIVVEAGLSSCQPLSAIAGRRVGVAWHGKFNCVEPEELDPRGTARLQESMAGVTLSGLGDSWGHCQRGVSIHKCSLKCSLVREARLWEMLLWG